jgi:hypothetical protein
MTVSELPCRPVASRRWPVEDPEGPLFGVLSPDDIVLRAEERMRTAPPRPISRRGVALAFRSVVSKPALRKSA